MKPFAELSQAGKTARLRSLATRTLTGYDLAVVSVRPLTTYYGLSSR